MSSNRRSLRSKPAATSLESTFGTVSSSVCLTSSTSLSPSTVIQVLAPGSRLPGLTPSELRLLRKKQSRLASTAPSILNSLPSKEHLRNALKASLIFTQHEAGSATCVDPSGWILTCSHCIGETEKEWVTNKRKWLLFYTGLAIQAECRAWDPKRDLALLKIIAVESNEGKIGAIPTFLFVHLSSQNPSYNEPIMCIGQPGSEDLESESSQRTKYNLIEVSEGTFRGMIHGVDPHDNAEIGTLKHNAWTYWGHSGSPLLREADGTLIGLHSSWDDRTAMRHGIPLVAIKHFLLQHMSAIPGLSTGTSTNVAQLHSLDGMRPTNEITKGEFTLSALAGKKEKETMPLIVVNESKNTARTPIIVIDDDDSSLMEVAPSGKETAVGNNKY